ncbi:MAG: hypothetical protein V4736_13700 [Bdellovibrionota bacterium]
MTEFERQQVEQVHSWALPRTRRAKVIRTENWLQLITEEYKSPGFNEIIHSSLSTEELENKIKETIETYRKIGTDFKWCTGPKTQPANTGDALRRHGFISWFSRVMYCSLENFNFKNITTNITVRRIDISEMDFFVDLFMRCWKMDPAERKPLLDQLLLITSRNLFTKGTLRILTA